MIEGWVKIHRRIRCSKPYSKGVEYLGAMAWFILNATPFDCHCHGVECRRGQVWFSQDLLEREWCKSRQEVRTILKCLRDSGFVDVKSTKSGSIATVVNYESYQCSQPTLNQQPTNEQPTANQIATNNQPYYKNKEEINNTPIPAPAPVRVHEGAGYPATAEQVAEIAADPRCGVVMTHEQAQVYLDKRSRVGWIDAAGRKVCNLYSDLRCWMLDEQQRGADRARGSPVGESAPRRELTAAEIEQAERDAAEVYGGSL